MESRDRSVKRQVLAELLNQRSEVGFNAAAPRGGEGAGFDRGSPEEVVERFGLLRGQGEGEHRSQAAPMHG